MSYASKGERAKCLWERHEPRKNKTSNGKIIERTFYSREAYIKGGLMNVSTAWIHQQLAANIK